MKEYERYIEKEIQYACQANDNIVGIFLIKDVFEKEFSIDELYFATQGIDGHLIIDFQDLQKALNNVGFSIIEKEIKKL